MANDVAVKTFNLENLTQPRETYLAGVYTGTFHAQSFLVKDDQEAPTLFCCWKQNVLSLSKINQIPNSWDYFYNIRGILSKFNYIEKISAI